MPCYEFNFTSNQPQLLPNVWIPCPSGDNCCIGLDTCMSNNICRDYGAVKARDGSYSSFYNARCTDPTYASPACDKVCIGAPPDMVYNYTSERWACCGRDKAGLISCNAPIVGEYYAAPAPGSLATLSAGAIYTSTATLTPDAGNHPTTYSYTTAVMLASSSSSSSTISSSSTSSPGISFSSTSSLSPSHTSSAASSGTTNPVMSTNSGTDLSTGAKAGLGVGVALGAILIVVLASCLFLRRRRRENSARRHDPSRQYMLEMPSNPLHARVFEKPADTRPPTEMYSSESDPRATEYSNGFSFQPSVR